jgi:hypothetical protein
MAKSPSAGFASRFAGRDFWLRLLAAARIASEERDRSFAAERRYAELRTGRAAAPSGGRGGKARQVFTEIYDSPDVWRTVPL